MPRVKERDFFTLPGESRGGGTTTRGGEGRGLLDVGKPSRERVFGEQAVQLSRYHPLKSRVEFTGQENGSLPGAELRPSRRREGN